MPIGFLASSIQRRVNPVSGQGDEHFSSVVFLCHCDNIDSNQTILSDESSQANSITLSRGDAQISGGKFGGRLRRGVLTASGTKSDDGDFSFGSGEFTIEYWIRRRGESVGTSNFIQKYVTSGGQRSWRFESSTLGVPPDRMGFRWSHNGSTNQNMIPNAPLPLDTWAHLAVTGDGSTLRMFYDGVVVASSTTNYGFYASSAPFSIQVENDSFDVDEIRITKGVARYTAEFTPPESPFPNS
jgi:hypothetical protein